MLKAIGILFGVICTIIIIKVIINKIKNNKEKEINFNEFDDLEKIKFEKHDKQHLENEWKEMRKIREEKNVIMTFHKKNNDLEQEGFLSNCQNCGAPISQIEFGKCKYCDSAVLPIRYNWVLVKFETI